MRILECVWWSNDEDLPLVEVVFINEPSRKALVRFLHQLWEDREKRRTKREEEREEEKEERRGEGREKRREKKRTKREKEKEVEKETSCGLRESVKKLSL